MFTFFLTRIFLCIVADEELEEEDMGAEEEEEDA